MMDDLINRQAVIEVFNQLAREKFSLRDEFQYYLNALIDAEDEIKALPSAQPEIIRCKECKHRDAEDGFCKGRGWSMQLVPEDGFCDKGKGGARMSDLISRETMKDAIDNTTWYHQNRNKDMVEGAHGVEGAWFKAEDVFKAIENAPTAQPNTPTDTPTDTISRQAAIDNLLSINEVVPKNKLIDKNDAVKMLVRLPSAQPERCEDCRNFNKARLLITQPERKKGKWIYLNGLDAFECSVCGRQMVRNIFDYCPWCGADMRGEQHG